jgi:hypothetical protein
VIHEEAPDFKGNSGREGPPLSIFGTVAFAVHGVFRAPLCKDARKELGAKLIGGYNAKCREGGHENERRGDERMNGLVRAASVFLAVVAAPSAVLADPAAVRARLDALLESHWKESKVPQPEAADDATFLRRVWLDLAGQTPPADQIVAFLNDRDPAKRARLVDRLLADDRFADHWGRVWAQALTGRRPTRQDKYDGRVLQQYLRDALKANRSYGDIVRELITGEGLSDASGPANFLMRYEAKPADLAGAVGRHFLGVSLQCAQCHDHPHARWKKDDFWGVAAFFGRIRLLEYGGENENYTAILETRRGELMLPDPNAKPDAEGKVPKKAVVARLPIKNAPAVKDKRRQVLADWITAESNPLFARQAVNRVWSQLFGAGLVPSLDSLEAGADNKPRAILHLLADDFTANHYDVKRLVRIVVLSRAYQMSAAAEMMAQGKKAATGSARDLGRFPVRPLSVDQLYASFVQATGRRVVEDDEPPAASNDELEDGDRSVDLLGERALTVQRALVLLNGAYVHQAVQAGAKKAVALHGDKPGPAHVEWLFLATLARRPTTEEAETMLKLARAGEGTAGLEDVLWALVNSAEFTSNH